MLAVMMILVFGVGVTWLQIFLSKKENKWFGLFMPTLCFCIVLLSIAIFVSASDGDPAAKSVGIISCIMFSVLSAVYIGIYAACRGKRNRQRALEKMSVQDLE